jgi:hypothetical protein
MWWRARWLAGARAGMVRILRAGKGALWWILLRLYMATVHPPFPLLSLLVLLPPPPSLVRDRRRAAVRRGCVQLRLVPGLRGVGHLLLRFVSGRSASYASRSAPSPLLRPWPQGEINPQSFYFLVHASWVRVWYSVLFMLYLLRFWFSCGLLWIYIKLVDDVVLYVHLEVSYRWCSRVLFPCWFILQTCWGQAGYD